VIVGIVTLTRPSTPESPAVAIGRDAPPIVGQTLDGSTVSLAALRGRPVIVNFWGPSCIPCRDEFPLFEQKLAEHAADGLAIVGVLKDDPTSTAIAFVRDMGATWPTVVDPDGAIAAAYRVAARPQSYFIDPSGVVRLIQVGQVAEKDFERLYAQIAP
jgi:cytochrome c biogenesis protein CcmG/thiol:disulfide interchange protein DsbE